MLTPVPDFLHQKCTSSPARLQLPRVSGMVKGEEVLPFAIIFCLGIERDF